MVILVLYLGYVVYILQTYSVLVLGILEELVLLLFTKRNFFGRQKLDLLVLILLDLCHVVFVL